ncbi:transporter substrate-binding domain-containing protein [Methanosarcina sp. DH2]|jgi:NitT/TauT family transport system substrate-binding protein|uniref:ABC transporter substrate-binding protein n=1 Tax=Methanosarcina sp. DH2 TaxID=2605639 RepID=UPI001E2832A9|nr:ABC transporter substrate-binding protein [Methanosarcina sp. DH2]MCC4769977.1 transporter substrate-binding domain-containing protein [Methanosarcina sp. DH2]
MKKAIVIVVSAVIIASLLFSLTGWGNNKEENTAQDEVKTVKIGYLPLTHALPLFVENDLSANDSRNFKVELVKFGSWTELSDAVNTGQVDGASMLIELAMKSKEQGIDLKTVALGHRDGNVVVVSKDITQVADLKGKTFAIPHRLSTHNVLLYKMLKENGLTVNDVNIVELPPPEMPAALSEGRISGYIVAEPFGAISVASDNGKVLFESQDLWNNSVCCGLVLRNDFIENNPTIAAEFVNEYVRAGERAESKDPEVLDAATKYMKVEPEVLDLSLQWISYNNLKLEEKDYNELSQYLVEMGQLKNPPEYSEFVDNSFIESVK